MEVDLEFLRTHRVVGRKVAIRILVGIANLLIRRIGRTQVVWQGKSLPDHPVIIATNHTHRLDFLPMWVDLIHGGHLLTGWVKARMYKHRRARWMMRSTGYNIPLVSKGYLIAADFKELFDRRPGEGEYRRLRDHLDHRQPLPKSPTFERLQTQERSILGCRFEPHKETYREALVDLYYRMMSRALDLAGKAVNVGAHLHIYPEGEVSQRLTRGHTGIVHVALALDLPIVPVGISGIAEAYIGNGPLTRGGEVRICVGEELEVDPELGGPDFRPFHPDDQVACDRRFQEVTDRVMKALNQLVDPSLRSERERGGSPQSDGVERFYR